MTEAAIIKFALQTRLSVVILQFLSNLVIPDHDAQVFLYPKPEKDNGTLIDGTINLLFGGFLRWDAQYFMHIAKYGYTYENTLAFFPLYPFFVGYFGQFLSLFIPFLNIDSILLIAFILFNIVCFCLSALCLYELSVIFFTHDLAYKAAILFCLNPASIFFSAPYTECLFSYLSFKSMLNCVILYQKLSENPNAFHMKDILYVVPISLSCVTRSNGLLNVGFFAYTLMCVILMNAEDMKIKLFLKYIVLTSLGIVICILPFLMFQYYLCFQFCTDFETHYPHNILAYANEHNFILPGEFSLHNQSWCYKILPLSYSYIQTQYWGVGFLKYYNLKQIPNFLLALPVLIISLSYCVKFLRKNAKFNFESIFNFDTNLSLENVDILQSVLLVYIVHAFVLTVFCIFFVHIQVSTRMLLSASPVVYWFCAHNFLSIKSDYNENIVHVFSYKARNPVQKCIKYYFLSYMVIGTVMFSNFLPWT